MIIFNEGIKSKRLTYKKNQLLHNVCMGQTITLLPPGKFPFHSEKRTMTSVRVPTHVPFSVASESENGVRRSSRVVFRSYFCLPFRASFSV